MDDPLSLPICRYCGGLMTPDRELFYKNVFCCHRCNHRSNGVKDYDDYQENDEDEE